jgi:hypothetical protein
MTHLISRKIITWIFLICSFIYMTMAFIPTTANACSCVPPPSVETALSRADVVFSGKVISVEEQRSLRGYITKKILFEVSQTWKGVNESQIIITTGSGGGDCGGAFSEGEEYLVYSRESDMYGKKQLITTICDRTVALSSANEDLGVLGEGKPPIKQVDIISDNQNRSTLIIMLTIFTVGVVGLFGWFKFWKFK